MVAAALVAAATILAGAGVAADAPVRAKMSVADPGRTVDVERILILDTLKPGERYRLPTIGIRNHRGVRGTYRLVVSRRAVAVELRPSQSWLHFVPPSVSIGAGRSRAVGILLELPDDAEPGVYVAVLGVHPGPDEATRLAFSVEPVEPENGLTRAATIAALLLVASTGTALVLITLRAGATHERRQ